MEHYWRPGDHVVLRNTGLFVGEVWGTPHFVISDSEDLVVLFRPEGTRWGVWHLEQQRLREVSPTKMDMLRLMFPGRGYAVELYFYTGRGPAYAGLEGAGRFRGWKVNIEAPFKRTAIGFDTIDDVVDIFVRPDRSWYWTDWDELDYWVKAGGYTEEDRARFMARGFQAESLLEAGASPFDDAWIDWEPPPEAGMPSLPNGWQFLEGAGITLSTGRRYDAWKPGRDVPGTIEGWYRVLDDHRLDPERRRFEPSRRPAP